MTRALWGFGAAVPEVVYYCRLIDAFTGFVKAGRSAILRNAGAFHSVLYVLKIA
jgi:hypothetical protein